MTAIWDMGLPPSEKLVLLALADWANDDGLCWPSIATVARKSGVSERTVQRTLRDAERAGLLKREEVKGKGCKYTFDPRHCVTGANLSRVTNETLTPDTVSPNTLRTTKGLEAIASTPKPWSRPTGISVEVWKDLLDNRKRKRLGNSPTAWKCFNDDLRRVSAESGWPPGKLIEHAAAKGWGAIYNPASRDQSNGLPGTAPTHRNRPNLTEQLRASIALEDAERRDPPNSERTWPALPSRSYG